MPTVNDIALYRTTTPPTLVTGRQVGSDGFAHAVAAHVRQVAEQVERIYPDHPQQAIALREFATAIESLDRADQRLRAIWVLNRMDSENYQPGERTEDFLAKLGARNTAVPPLTESLAEFVASAAEDAHFRAQEEITSSTREFEALRDGAKHAESTREEVAHLKAKLEDAIAEADTARTELRDVTADRDLLRRQVIHPTGPKSKAKPKARKVKRKAKA